MKLIDKDKVEEILRNLWKEDDGRNSEHRICYNKALWDVQYKIDSLETKEAASIWNDARKTIPEDSSNQIICIKEDDLAVATIGKLVHDTKKWAYLNDLLNISNVETKEVNLEKELETLDRILFDLDGVAVQGATYYLTVEDVKDIAKRFYELGLNAQKKNKTMDKDLKFLENAVLHKQCYNCALNKKCIQDDPYFEPIGTCNKWTGE